MALKMKKQPACVAHFFDTVAQAYPLLNQELTNFIDTCFSQELLEKKRILDVGCGTGMASEYFLNGQQGYPVIGIDISWRYLQIAKQACDNRISLLQVRVPHLPFKDKAFDIVFSKGTLAYISDIRSTLCELLRVLKDDGFLILEFLKKTPLTQIAELLRRFLSKTPKTAILPLAKSMAFSLFPLAKRVLGEKVHNSEGKKLDQLLIEVFFSTSRLYPITREFLETFCTEHSLKMRELPVANSKIFSPKTSFVVKIWK